MHLPLKVIKIRQENPTFRTYIFKHELRSKPGQFVMVWLPGVDEVPMSVAWEENGETWIGISKSGDCTSAIFKKIKEGDRLGIRGPFGKSFELKPGSKKILLIGGGFGTPPLLYLAKEATSKGIRTSVILGARTPELILYENEFRALDCDFKGAVDTPKDPHSAMRVLEEKVAKEKFDQIYTCGPEKMMKRVAEIAETHKIGCQVSLERYMKCGFGICGQCCVDESGLRVCKDGPVFDGKQALGFKEFGKYTRSASGRRKNL